MTRAEAIMREGRFRSSNEGQVGPGAYFWAYEEDPFLAHEYGVQWWMFASHHGMYADDKDKSCAVLGVDVEKPEEEFLDLTEESTQNQLARWAAQHGCADKDQMAQISRDFIDTIERQAGIKFAVIKASIPRPPKFKKRQSRPMDYFGAMPHCYVVRHERHDLVTNIRLLPSERKEST
ncbi:hypothetical protein [Achromobacter ruhlandii]|uniref:hypothetical protein n=1 Tax=Achromobacter ruhlandii TaxID=72557 RepID=UPI00301907AB